jgi:hypothetical protein
MKKFSFLFAAFILSVLYTDAQRSSQNVKWLSLAGKACLGNSYFLDVDHIEDKNLTMNYFSLSQSFGGRFTFTYGERAGIGADVLFSAYNQKYEIQVDSTSVNNKNIKLNTLDIMPFFRFTGYNTVYFEIGAKLSTIKKLSETNSMSGLYRSTDELMTHLEPKFTSAFLGFGGALYKTDRLDVNLGLRLAYSFTDVAPGYNILNDNVYVPNYTNDFSLNPISVQAVFEVNYFFAFWGDASCGRGRLMLFK